MKILTGHMIKDVQRALNERNYKLAIDGAAGPMTTEALEDFQRKNGLYADGVVGVHTANILFSKDEGWKDVEKRFKFVRVNCDPWGTSTGEMYLREDAAKQMLSVRDILHAQGAKLTTSGGRRLLNASVGPTRSKTSLHYLGLAHDLNVNSGMVDPENDPYVITQGGTFSDVNVATKWTVWARCSSGEFTRRTLQAYTYRHRVVEVEGDFVDLTKLMREHCFEPISPRRSFFTRGNKMAAEWWHFQFDRYLVAGKSTFGGELLKSFKLRKLQKYSLWEHRNRVWQRDWF